MRRMRGYCADSCARVKGAPTNEFREGVRMAGRLRAEQECERRADDRFLAKACVWWDACAEYECERRTDARMLRWLMRTRKGRADVWIFAKAYGARMLAREAGMRRMRGCSADSCERVKGAPMRGYCADSCARVKGAPTSGYCADSCARVKSAPTSDFCEGVWGADACVEYECERRTDERISRRRVYGRTLARECACGAKAYAHAHA